MLIVAASLFRCPRTDFGGTVAEAGVVEQSCSCGASTESCALTVAASGVELSWSSGASTEGCALAVATAGVVERS